MGKHRLWCPLENEKEIGCGVHNGLCDPGWKQRVQLGYTAIQVRGDGDLDQDGVVEDLQDGCWTGVEMN